MSSKHLVDRELTPLIELFPNVSLGAMCIDQVRAKRGRFVPSALVVTPGVEILDVRVPGRHGAPDVRVLISKPESPGTGRPGILHMHGGGFIIGTAEMTLATDAEYVLELGAVVVSVDYRLAPETPHPGPVEDCYAALDWFYRSAEELGVDRERIIVSGESAGGGLAAALTLLARDRGVIPVAFQHLVAPMLDDRTATNPSSSPFIGEFVWTPENNRFAWASLLGREPDGTNVSPYAAPARAEDLSGLPPTYISVGTLDLFVEEDLDYANRLIRAGVPTELHIYPGAPHGFQAMKQAEVSRASARDSKAALARAVRKHASA